jgi:FkbM family methyltransferase
MKRIARISRVLVKQLFGLEPVIRRNIDVKVEFHGNSYGGWSILADSLNSSSVVVDVGLGEDISFSTSLIERYGCVVYGFDPTPRAVQYVERLSNGKVKLFKYAVGAITGKSSFYLPNDSAHVSGSLQKEEHLGKERILVNVVGFAEVMRLCGTDRIDLLKMDIEGGEYEVLQSPEFAAKATSIGQICVEFHHRWKGIGMHCTIAAVDTLKALGFACAWGSRTTNEEFLFVRKG